MTRQALIAFTVFTVLGLGIVFWFVQNSNSRNISFQPSQVSEQEKIRIIFVGDIMLSRAVGRQMEKRNDYLYPFREVEAEVKAADLAFGNLEGPVSNRGRNQGSIYSFRADPRTVEGLAFAGFDVVSLANNHIWDWGRLALEDTIVLLQEKGISPVGAGRNEAEANAPVIREVKDTKIAFLAYTPLYPKGLEAEGSSAGVSAFDPERIIAQIQQLNNQADIIVVSFHWGDEYQAASNASQQQLARALIDAGADLVIGHHPHVRQEVEKYPPSPKATDGHSGWIAYSLGNFIFDQNFSEATREGLAVIAQIENKQVIGIEAIEVKISETFQPSFSPL